MGYAEASPKTWREMFIRNDVNTNINFLWEYSERHQWKTTPASVKHDFLVSRLSSKKRLTIEEMQHIATQRGGTCLSSHYKNIHSKLYRNVRKGIDH